MIFGISSETDTLKRIYNHFAVFRVKDSAINRHSIASCLTQPTNLKTPTTMASTRDFIIGTLTGLTIGFLSAPQTGKASRKWLKDEYDKRMNSSSGSSGSSDWQEQLKTIFEKAKAEVMKYVDEKTGNERKPTRSNQFDYQRDRMEPRVAPAHPEPLTTPISPTQMASPATGTIPSSGSYGV